jgi:hypothetical protein
MRSYCNADFQSTRPAESPGGHQCGQNAGAHLQRSIPGLCLLELALSYFSRSLRHFLLPNAALAGFDRLKILHIVMIKVNQTMIP